MKTLIPALLIVAMISRAAADSTAVADGINQFGIELHNRLATAGGNVVTSPWSTEAALAMTYAGAAGKTKDEMRAVLHFPQDEAAVHAGFQSISADLKKLMGQSRQQVKEAKTEGGPATPIEINVANRLFGQKDFAFLQPFLNLTATSYGAPLEPMDFDADPAKCTNAINQWVASQTKDRIRNLLSPEVITRDTRLVLTNAIYLKAPWAAEFGEIKAEPFFVNGSQQVMLPTLSGHRNFGYEKLTGGAAVTVPYAGGGLQFVLFVPDAKDGLAAMEKQLTPAIVRKTASAPARDIILHFPKFKLEPDSVKLSQNLIAMGMPTAFDKPEGSADFSRMATRKPNDYLCISEVVHKAFIAVDKHGTEAAAATAVVMPRVTAAPPTEKPEPLVIKVDRPFAFAIQHKASAACLFLGRVVDPR